MDTGQVLQHDRLCDALQQLTSALELLDRASAPSAIGANVDLAIHELYGVIVRATGGSRLIQIDRNAIPQ